MQFVNAWNAKKVVVQKEPGKTETGKTTEQTEISPLQMPHKENRGVCSQECTII